jgi:hypothetical protein
MADLLQLRDSSGALFTGVEFQQNRLVLPEDLSGDKLKELIRVLVTIEQCSLWYWGDLLNYLKRKRGYESALEAAAQTDNPQRLLDTMVIAEAFPVRVSSLGWQFHREAYLEAGRDASAAIPWLKQAGAEGWSVAEMRRQIRESHRVVSEPVRARSGIPVTITGALGMLRSAMKKILTDNPLSEWDLNQVVALREDIQPILDLAKAIDARLQELAADFQG